MNIKNALSILLLLGAAIPVFSQCALYPLTLAERVDQAKLIVEGRIDGKMSYWNDERTMIFTSGKLLVSRVYKGEELLDDQFLMITVTGGTIGNESIRVDPELEFETGEIGIFMLVEKDGKWVSESGPQGMIRIDKHTAEAADVFYRYEPFSIRYEIEKLTGRASKVINSRVTDIRLQAKRAAPAISSFSPASITAGTSSILTIRGSNFNQNMDTGSVQFRNGDNGGLSYIKALKRDYILWSDTLIRLMVRTRAGTGKIRVVAAGNGIVVSTDTLKISYAHLNVVQGDTIGYETRQIGMNNNNGITWKLNQAFYDSAGARNAFIRSLERWRCGTYINWDTSGRVSHSAIKPDGVNMCAWDTASNMPSGVLAQCFSYWSGCFTPGLKWYVNELDIRFRKKPTGSTNWNYSTGNAQSNQFHFESVATHELGHGHQLGHVINSALVMHFSIANGQTKPNLSTGDIDAGDYVIGKSLTTVCGRNAHSKLNSGNCAMVAPNAQFVMSEDTVCISENIIFTDSSTGNISSYSWNFGSGASPSSANGIGPHSVSYSSGGNKNISLTITTVNGNTVRSKNLFVRNDEVMKSSFIYNSSGRGLTSFINLSNNPLSSLWEFGNGDTSHASNPVYTYPAEGPYQVKLSSTNNCNTDDTTIMINPAYLDFGPANTLYCLNQPVQYNDSSKGSIATWTWTFPDGFPGAAAGKGPHHITYSTPGFKNVTLQITTTEGKVQVFNRDSVVSISNDTFTKASFRFGYYGKNIVGFENLSTGSGMSFKWFFGDGDSSLETNPVHTYANALPKSVRLIASGQCGTDDTTILLPDFTGIHSLNEENGLKLHPNPAAKTITVLLTGTEFYQWEITDLSGKTVLKGVNENGSQLSVESLETGTYLFKAFGKNGRLYTQIFIKNHDF